MTKAEAWDKLTQKLDKMDIKGLLARSSGQMYDARHVGDYKDALITVNVIVDYLLEEIVEQSVEE